MCVLAAPCQADPFCYLHLKSYLNQLPVVADRYAAAAGCFTGPKGLLQAVKDSRLCGELVMLTWVALEFPS